MVSVDDLLRGINDAISVDDLLRGIDDAKHTRPSLYQPLHSSVLADFCWQALYRNCIEILYS